MFAIFEALQDPTRLRILALLLDGEHAVGDLVDALGVAQPSVSKHLARLKTAGLVALRTDAQRRIYRLQPEAFQEVEDWLAPFRRRLRAAKPVEMGSLEQRPTGFTIHYDLYIPASRERIWAALSEPSLTREWLGVTTIEPVVDGRYKVRFLEGDTVMSCRIMTWEPGRTLMYRWRTEPMDDTYPISRICFELEQDGDGTRVQFSHRDLPWSSAIALAPVWHVHLEWLVSLVEGVKPVRDSQRLATLRALYVKRLNTLKAA